MPTVISGTGGSTVKFSGEEFAKALTDGSLHQSLVVEGFVRRSEINEAALSFSADPARQPRVDIPIELIEEVEHFPTIGGSAQGDQFVRIVLKEPTNNALAKVFAELLKWIPSPVDPVPPDWGRIVPMIPRRPSVIPWPPFADPAPLDWTRLSLEQLRVQLHTINTERLRLDSLEQLVSGRLAELQNQ